MKKLFLIMSLFPVCMHAMEHSGKLPKNIFDAINKRDQYAVDYYIRFQQVEYLDDSCGFVCAPPGLWGPCMFCPWCVCLGEIQRSPLYYALEKKNFTAARALIAAGASLGKGKSKYSPIDDGKRMRFSSASLLLVKLARTNALARGLLQDVVTNGAQILTEAYDGRNNDELCRELLALDDRQVLQQIARNNLIPLARLAQHAATRQMAEFIVQLNRQPVAMLPSAAPAQAAPPAPAAQVQPPSCGAAFEFESEGCVHSDCALPMPPASAPSVADDVREESSVVDDCPVCSEPLSIRSYVRRLPCGHNVHGECASRWLGEHHTCPVCRQPVG